jgi:hypothetical protein
MQILEKVVSRTRRIFGDFSAKLARADKSEMLIGICVQSCEFVKVAVQFRGGGEPATWFIARHKK